MRIFHKNARGIPIYLIQQGKDSSQAFMNLYNKNGWHLQEMGTWIPEKTLDLLSTSQFYISSSFLGSAMNIKLSKDACKPKTGKSKF